MEPLPETREALREFAEYDDAQLKATLLSMGARAKELVPECVGLSLSMVEDGLTFTLVATDEELAVLDAVQYLDGGPCVDAIGQATTLENAKIDPLDEERWQMFARASAAAGVASSLSLPILDGDRVIGGVNLYAATPDAFRGRHEQLASALSASAEGAVANADLEFRTRRRAAEAVSRIRDLESIDIAVGIIAVSQGIEFSAAREHLRQAALRAGITELQAARAIRNLRDA